MRTCPETRFRPAVLEAPGRPAPSLVGLRSPELRLYVAQTAEDQKPLPSCQDELLYSGPEQSRARRFVARRSALLMARTAVEDREGGKEATKAE
jgi:hypothetical protein